MLHSLRTSFELQVRASQSWRNPLKAQGPKWLFNHEQANKIHKHTCTSVYIYRNIHASTCMHIYFYTYVYCKQFMKLLSSLLFLTLSSSFSFLSPSFLPLSTLFSLFVCSEVFCKQEKITMIVYLKISTQSQKHAQIKDSIKMNDIIQQLQQLPKQVIGRVWFDKLWSFSLNFAYQYQYQ